MRETLRTAVGSFGMNNAAGQVEKAWRELERCRAATGEDDLRDAAINCAIAIWHVNDWVWTAIAQGKKDRPAVASLLGVAGRKLVKDDLVKWAVAKCPELEMVQAVCNASKHVAVIGIRYAAAKAPSTGPGRRLLVIADANAEHDALFIFDRAIDFWVDQATNEYVLH
jgi:hypothetical protein